MRYTELATVYLQSTEKDQYRNVLPGWFVAIFQNLPCNIHRGGTDAKNDASALDIQIDKGAIGYCPIAYREWIRSNLLITTRPKEFWRVAAEPDFRDRFPRSAHVRFVLELQTQEPKILTS